MIRLQASSLREKSLFLELKNKSKWTLSLFWKVKFRSTLIGGIFINIWSDFSHQKKWDSIPRNLESILQYFNSSTLLNIYFPLNNSLISDHVVFSFRFVNECHILSGTSVGRKIRHADHCEKCQLHFCRWHCWRDHYFWIACTNYDHLRSRV